MIRRRARNARSIPVAVGVLAALLPLLVWLSVPLTREAPRLLASNQIDNFGGIVELKPAETFCQDFEQLPAEATALVAYVGIPTPASGPLEVSAYGGREPVIARSGRLDRTGPATFPLPRHPVGVDATLCVRNLGRHAVSIGGETVRSRRGASGDSVPTVSSPSRLTDVEGKTETIAGRARIEYPLEGGPRSPLDMAGIVARRSGLWHGAIGGPAWMWIALGLTVLAGGLAVLAAVRLPRRALALVAAVGFINAAGWALLTPQFQVPDEAAHVGYVQYLAETGRLPESPVREPRPPEDLSLAAGSVPFTTLQKPDWVAAHERAVERFLENPLDRVDARGAGYISNNPPLYYLAQALPYRASLAAPTIFDRVTALRLVNALLVGLLAALIFAFLRELAPASPRLAVVGALAVALHPMIGFLGGGVNPDIFLACTTTAMLWLIVRMFRRGPDLRTGAAAGVLLGAALVTKPAALAVVPGAGLLFGALLWSAPRPLKRRALAAGALAGAAALALFELWSWSDSALFGRELSATAGFSSTETRGGVLNLREGISTVWQFYLPPLPFMDDRWPDEVPLWRTWWEGFIGRFGWHQYEFPTSVSVAALGVLAVLGAFAGRALWSARGVLRERWAELVALVGALAVLALFVHAAGYRYRLDSTFEFEQIRYLFPVLLPLYGAFILLAIRGTGRFAVPAIAFLLTLLAGHDLAAQLLTLQRYYL